MSQPSFPGPGDDPGLPGGAGGVPGGGARDERLAWFAYRAPRPVPSGGLAEAMEDLAGAGWRYAGGTDDELAGMLAGWHAVASWVEAQKLRLVREMIRRSPAPVRRGKGAPAPAVSGELPDMPVWHEGLAHEVALILSISLPAADKLLILAWELEARLPALDTLLGDGTLDPGKVRLIVEEFQVLDDEHAARAEQCLLDELCKHEGQDGLTAGKWVKLAQRIADTDGARRRREAAEREEARVRFWRQHGGAAGMSARGLPTDEALRANARIDARARAYKQHKFYPGARLDQLRVPALLDILNDRSLQQRIAKATAEAEAGSEGAAAAGTEGAGEPQPDPADDATGNGGSGPGDGSGPGSGGTCRCGGRGGEADPGLAAHTNLTIPMLTALRLADRPGEANGLGSIGHGCARPRRRKPASASSHGRDGPPGTWVFARLPGQGPPGGYGTWLLTLPDGREFTVDIEPVPTETCDHRHESRAYRPSDKLRHLVQIRDGECTHPCCTRHARETDFEHAIPYDQGGKTCACNAGARSRRCHRVKQSKGWKVTQPRPGWHHWTTPSGRTYIQGPMQYPV
jgi:hypothetical protein